MAGTTNVCCTSPFFLRTTDLVIPKERTPGTTAEQERLHERSFGLHGVHQIVSGPGVKHLRQRDYAQLAMLGGLSQVAMLDVLEQSKPRFPSTRERCHELLRRL